MKLSEAIREGIGDTEQAFGDLWRFKNGKLGLCALGAALNAVHPEFWEDLPSLRAEFMLYEAFPELDFCADEYGPDWTWWDAVSNLNDRKQWGRLAIAEWLERRGL